MSSIMRWRSGLMGVLGIAKAPVSHGFAPHDLETGPRLRVPLQPSPSSSLTTRPYRASCLVLGSNSPLPRNRRSGTKSQIWATEPFESGWATSKRSTSVVSWAAIARKKGPRHLWENGRGHSAKQPGLPQAASLASWKTKSTITDYRRSQHQRCFSFRPCARPPARQALSRPGRTDSPASATARPRTPGRWIRFPAAALSWPGS